MAYKLFCLLSDLSHIKKRKVSSILIAFDPAHIITSKKTCVQQSLGSESLPNCGSLAVCVVKFGGWFQSGNVEIVQSFC